MQPDTLQSDPKTATIRELVELLLKTDPEALFPKHASLLTPQELWDACGQDMSTVLGHREACPEIIPFLINEGKLEELLDTDSTKLTPDQIEPILETNPGLCLQYLENLTPEQKNRCIQADLLAAAEYAPDDLTDAQVQSLLESDPKIALMYLHSRLDDETFNRLVMADPETAWRSNPHRFNLDFLEKHYVTSPTHHFEIWQLSDDQIKLIAKEYPKFASKKLRRLLKKSKKTIIPEWQAPGEDNPKKRRAHVHGIIWSLLGAALAIAILRALQGL